MARKSLHAIVLALAATLTLASCASPTSAPETTSSSTPAPEASGSGLDAAVSRGGFQTQEAAYELPDLTIQGLPRPVEMVGHVVGPVGAEGSLPLAVFLHGYNASCWDPASGDSTGDWPCPRGFEPIPSWKGFDYLQRRLASQGYLTTSISAHGVNVMAGDVGKDAGAAARSELVTHHLDAWAAGEVPGLGAWPDVDLSSVLLVGHSRGGEGMDWTAAQRPQSAPWVIAGEVLIAPTAFAPPSRAVVPVVTLTGYCDGDVGPGAQQRYIDRAADTGPLRSSILLMGANHNFFNAEWVPGASTVPGGADDAFDESGTADSQCQPDAPTRLTAQQQQDVAARVVGLAGAALVRGNRAAGDVLDGRVPMPVAEGIDARVSAVGRGRTTLSEGHGYSGSGSGPMSAQACRGVSETEDPDDCGADTGEGVSVHWPAIWRDPSPVDSLALEWSEAGAAAHLEFDAPQDLGAAAGLEARVAVLPVGPPVQFDVTLTDTDGATATVAGENALVPYEDGTTLPPRRWGQRFFASLETAGAVDLARISSVDLVARTAPGKAWIIDVSLPPK